MAPSESVRDRNNAHGGATTNERHMSLEMGRYRTKWTSKQQDTAVYFLVVYLTHGASGREVKPASGGRSANHPLSRR